MVSYIESLLSFQKLFFFLKKTLHLLLQLIVYIEDIIVAYPKGNVLFFNISKKHFSSEVWMLGSLDVTATMNLLESTRNGRNAVTDDIVTSSN